MNRITQNLQSNMLCDLVCGQISPIRGENKYIKMLISNLVLPTLHVFSEPGTKINKIQCEQINKN